MHCRITHSLCLGGLVEYFSQTEQENKMTTNVGLMYAAGLFLSVATSAISCHPYMIFVNKIACYIRIGMTGLIYKKVDFCSQMFELRQLGLVGV